MTGIPELKDAYRQLGAGKFWVATAGTTAFIALFIWSMLAAEWPGQCDHEGRKLWGMVKQLHCSPDLLSGGLTEWILFAMLWSLPALVAALLGYAFIKKLRQRDLS